MTARRRSGLSIPLISFVVASAVFAPALAQDGQVRLSPSEIESLSRGAAGAGTSGVPGIQTTTLFGDPTQPGPYAIEIRVPPNTRIVAHSHRDHRSAVVISGIWYFGYGEIAADSGVETLPPGSFYTEPANDPHFALTRAEPAVVYIFGVGPTDTVFTASAPAH